MSPLLASLSAPVRLRTLALFFGVLIAALLAGTAARAQSGPDHIRFLGVPVLTDTNTALSLLLRAENADGSLATNFSGSVSLIASALEGALPLDTTNSGAFTQGTRYIGVRVLAPGHAVQIGCLEYPGQSDPFTVIIPAFYPVSQPVADIAWLN